MTENTSSARKYENEFEYDEKAKGARVLDFGAYALPLRARERRFRRAQERYEALYTLLALYPERAGAVCLALYFALRFTVCHSVAFGSYYGALTLLLPAAWGLVLLSYVMAHVLRAPDPSDF
jgi:hypothetical protein